MISTKLKDILFLRRYSPTPISQLKKKRQCWRKRCPQTTPMLTSCRNWHVMPASQVTRTSKLSGLDTSITMAFLSNNSSTPPAASITIQIRINACSSLPNFSKSSTMSKTSSIVTMAKCSLTIWAQHSLANKSILNNSRLSTSWSWKRSLTTPTSSTFSVIRSKECNWSSKLSRLGND